MASIPACGGLIIAEKLSISYIPKLLIEKLPPSYSSGNNFPELIILGIDHKDKKEDAVKFLSDNGNPYTFVGVDLDGMIGLEFGVFGLPETYLINNSGTSM